MIFNKLGIFSKIISINFFVLVTLLISFEFSFRLFKFSFKCFKNQCDSSLFTLRPYQKSLYLGLTKKDRLLGYVPNKNISTVINRWNWEKVKITTNELGLRNSIMNKSSKNILTVGDSFTWGDQVSDEETWQSCLNRKNLNHNFLNGGVFGYGTAQAIMRAQKLYPLIEPDGLLVSTMVGNNFDRDQLSIRTGFPKPFLSLSPLGDIEVKFVESFDIPNTKFSSKNTIKFRDHLFVNFTFLSLFRDNFIGKKYLKTESKFTSNISVLGLNPATKNEIINWSVSQSLKLSPKVVWLLQYQSKINKNILQERQYLKKVLKTAKVKVIDTFDYLHGDNKQIIDKEKLWTKFTSHHTALGNEVVCKVIIDSGIYPK